MLLNRPLLAMATLLRRHPRASLVVASSPTPHRLLHSATRLHGVPPPVAGAALRESPGAHGTFGRGLSARQFAVTPGPSARLKVAVDIDEVLGQFVRKLNEYVKEVHGWDHSVDDYWVYEFAKVWHCSQDESNAIVHEFFKSPHFKDGIETIPGARRALEQLSVSCDLVVVTSRQHVIQDATLEWLDRHYGGLFQDVYFGNHWAQAGASKKKSDICRQAGAHVLIDDNVGYAADCAGAGIHVLLYDWKGKYPWSKMAAGSSHELITVVQDWTDVQRALHKHALALNKQPALP